QIIQLACFIPPALLRRVRHQAGSDKDVGRGSMFACPTHYGRNDAAAFCFQVFQINSVILEDEVGIVASLNPSGLLSTLDLSEVGDPGLLAGCRQYVS